MLVNLSEILKIAEEKGIAIGAFNTPNLTSLKAIIAAAEELNQPVIIMHAQVHEEMDLCTIEEVAPMMVAAAKRASVPVCVHLDHGTDLDYVKRGLDLGFTSVMYDGSTLSTEENIKNTITAVQMAHEKGASVEAEIGSMGTREGGNGNDTSIYTDPDTAKDFVVKTGVDALACAFGTAHGFYKDTPKLDFDRLSKINSLIDVPIVMHGGSGVSEEDYREVIKRGVRKVNYYTYMAKAGGEALSGKQYSQFHDALLDAREAMKQNVAKAIKVFCGE
ncbi:MAG: class II fructose-bisphosphate aldolase [Clostridia bacterium]|nr:class II fructose-bisphosphate aldolase [Clostridia bacterium]MBQ2316162.1 class II fructose-bisphosphate aldolase [Clostridia bacterium]MEE0808711.1 class II fructose-bisphosphate aldolase [Acutalibacteraceae bacterium]